MSVSRETLPNGSEGANKPEPFEKELSQGHLSSGSIEQRSRWFTFQGTRYHFIQWQEAKAPMRTEAPRRVSPLVFLHGFSQRAESWSEIAVLLAQKSTVYALDLVGHGESERAESALPYALDAQGGMLLAFLERVQRDKGAYETVLPSAVSVKEPGADVPGKPIVVGYSMGGRVALAAAQQRPGAFGALVLESAGIGPATERDRQATAKRDTACAARLRTQGVELFMDFWEQLPLFATQRDLPQEIQKHIRAARLNNSAEALARSFQYAGQHVMPSRKEVFTTLRALQNCGASVRYLTGEQDEKYCALAKELVVEGLAQAQSIEGSGHNVHLEKPLDFIQALPL